MIVSDLGVASFLHQLSQVADVPGLSASFHDLVSTT